MTAPGSSRDDPPALRWQAEALQQELAGAWPGLAVQVLARCESTNSLLLDRAREGGSAAGAPQRAPCLLVAEQQTRGRGRMGRTWLAAPGASLTFSLGLPLAPRDWSGLSLAIGLALAEALDPVPAPPSGQGGGGPDRPASIWLKWPNDLWLVPRAAADAGTGRAEAAEGAKLGGILVETVSTGADRFCVIGIGLNVQPLPSAVAEGLHAGHACLQALDADANAPAVLRRVAAPLLRALRAFEREGFAPLLQRYAARDLLRGHEVSTSLAEPAAGRAEGVDEQGALWLRAGGQRHRIVSGEVSVRRTGPRALATGDVVADGGAGARPDGEAGPRPLRSA